MNSEGFWEQFLQAFKEPNLEKFWYIYLILLFIFALSVILCVWVVPWLRTRDQADV